MNMIAQLYNDKKYTVVSDDDCLFLGTVSKVKKYKQGSDKASDIRDQVVYDIEDFILRPSLEDTNTFFKETLCKNIELNNVELLAYVCQIRKKSLKKEKDLAILLKAGFTIVDIQNDSIFLQLCLKDPNL